jgi:hypothetical protein
MPSSAFVAREFNLRDPSPCSVTHEGVRRWLRGLSLPNPHRMEILFEWLEIDPTSIWEVDALKDKTHGNPARQRRTSSAQALHALCDELSPQHQNALLKFLQSTYHPPPPKSQSGVGGKLTKTKRE